MEDQGYLNVQIQMYTRDKERERVKTKLFTQNVRGIYSAKWSGRGCGGDKNMVAEKIDEKFKCRKKRIWGKENGELQKNPG